MKACLGWKMRQEINSILYKIFSYYIKFIRYVINGKLNATGVYRNNYIIPGRTAKYTFWCTKVLTSVWRKTSGQLTFFRKTVERLYWTFKSLWKNAQLYPHRPVTLCDSLIFCSPSTYIKLVNQQTRICISWPKELNIWREQCSRWRRWLWLNSRNTKNTHSTGNSGIASIYPQVFGPADAGCLALTILTLRQSLIQLRQGEWISQQSIGSQKCRNAKRNIRRSYYLRPEYQARNRWQWFKLSIIPKDVRTILSVY